MAISASPVHQATGSGTGASLAVSITAAASGNTLIAVIGVSNNSSISSVSSTNTTWAKQKAATSYWNLEIWSGSVSGGASGTTVTITPAASGTVLANITEWSGVLSPSPVDVTVGAGGHDTSPAAPWALTTGYSGELGIAAENHDSATGPTASPSGYTALTGVSASGGYLASAYKVPVSAGTQPAISYTLAATQYWQFAWVFFRRAAEANAQTLTETATLTDTLPKRTAKTLALETAALTDTLPKRTAKTLALEALSITDTVAAIRIFMRTLAETLALTDTLGRAAAAVRAETVTVTGSLAHATARTFTETAAVTDALVRSAAKALAETAAMLDSVLFGRFRALVLSETVTLTDTLGRARRRWVQYLMRRRPGLR